MNKYEAHFTNGKVTKRASRTMTYTHGWFAVITYNADCYNPDYAGKTMECKGFSGSEALAHSALSAYTKTGKGFECTFAEVQPVKEG